MNALRPTTLMFMLLPLLVAGAGPVAAQGLPAEEMVRELVLAASDISLDQAVKMVEKRYKARVVRAEARSEDGRTIYVLRLLDDKRVWTVRVDASSGKIL